jgi:hypothetical protein
MKMVFGSSSKIGQENVSQLKDVGPGRWLGVFVSISGVKSSAVSQRM